MYQPIKTGLCLIVGKSMLGPYFDGRRMCSPAGKDYVGGNLYDTKLV